MDDLTIIKKLGARLYLEMMPKIYDYNFAQKFSPKLFSFLNSNPSSKSLIKFLYSNLGNKITPLQSNILAKILLTDYISYKALSVKPSL